MIWKNLKYMVSLQLPSVHAQTDDENCNACVKLAPIAVAQVQNDSSDPGAYDRLQRVLLQACVDEVSDRQFVLIILLFFQHITIPETAACQDLVSNSVNVKLIYDEIVGHPDESACTICKHLGICTIDTNPCASSSTTTTFVSLTLLICIIVMRAMGIDT